MEQKLNIMVLMGGVSAEHDVSLVSGTQVIRGLDTGKYNVKPVIILRNGKWLIPQGYLQKVDPVKSVFDLIQDLVVFSEVSAGSALDAARDEEVDVVFIALHGPYGEDGTVQGMLELADIPYTGSGVLASSLAMDKVRCKNFVSCFGVPVAPQVVHTRREWEESRARVLGSTAEKFGFPCVVKAPEQGSSRGMGIPRDREELERTIEDCLKYDDRFMVEKFIAGTEITCSVLHDAGNVSSHALGVTQIVPIAGEFYDYSAKYEEGGSEHAIPAPIGPELTEKVSEYSVMIHDGLGCGAISRSDFIIADGKPVYLETNTIPGMTPTSLLPEAAAYAGISFSELLEKIIEHSTAAWRSIGKAST
ncbi:D-alanine--D-alanine ligase [Candidatus Hydrogenedentota bacterium]